MKYSLIASFAFLSLSIAACLPKADPVPASSCTNNHASVSIASTTHNKAKHRSHSRHRKPAATTAPPQTNSIQPNPASSVLVPDNLVPQFGIQSGVDPNNGNCKGLNGILIPCACPPDRNAFIAKMTQFVSAGNAEGTPISFPLDNSLNSQITRLTASIVTLQNFDGSPGRGCPASSTTFVGQRAVLLAQL